MSQREKATDNYGKEYCPDCKQWVCPDENYTYDGESYTCPNCGYEFGSYDYRVYSW